MTLQTPWAILACKWSDMLVEAVSIAFLEQTFTKTGRGTFNIVDFFDDNSNGNVDTGDSKVFGWLTLPHPRSNYTGSGSNPQGRIDLINWARQAATSAGVDLSQFFNVVVCMNATAAEGTDWFGGGFGVVCDTNVLQTSAIAQEMGHGYGLDHSRRDGSDADYMDPFDAMSTLDSCFMQPNFDYGLIGPGLNAANMAGRGWLDQSRVWDASSGSFNTTLQLRPLHRRDLPGFLAARLGEYFVEFRSKERWDAAFPRSAVFVHRFEGNHSYLMTGTEGQNDLVAGSSFSAGSDEGSYFQNTLSLDVIEIDDAGESATIGLRHNLRTIPQVGPGVLFGGIAQGGGGWLFVGGKFTAVPPRSPFVALLEQIAVHQSVDALQTFQLRETVQREALSSIRGIVEKQLASMRSFREPAPLHKREAHNVSPRKDRYTSAGSPSGA